MGILSAEKFIQALQGLEVKTETSKVISFLQKDYKGRNAVRVMDVII
ncbi:MAG: hypothetical protein RIG77_22990 [Cyclobacteriaceae bacterium]